MEKTVYRRRQLSTEALEARILLASDLAMADVYWSNKAELPAGKSADSVSHLQLVDYSAFTLEIEDVRSILQHAPMEFTDEATSNALTFGLPTPDGKTEYFAVVESPVMEPELAAKFPEIKTYAGVSLDHPGSKVRLDVTPLGLHAMVRAHGDGESYYIDPYYHLETTTYVSYSPSDAIAHDVDFTEGVFDANGELIYMHEGEDHDSHDHEESGEHRHFDVDANMAFHEHSDFAIHDDANHPHGEADVDGQSHIPRTGTELRTYRAAIAATGEYTSFFGGTVVNGQSAIVTMMNRVSGVYEDELTVRMVLVGDNSDIVYTNPGSDPFPNSINLGTIQSVIDSNIGSANYDIGHLVDTGGGGFAGLGVIGIAGQKARGYTGLTPPNNDPFWIDFVAHELGHQYGGNHTFNGDSGNCAGGARAGNSAFEPGSGSTIMAYAGICSNDNLQNNSDPYFHSRSLDEILSVLASRPGVGTYSDTGNTVPTADAGMDYAIPMMTPFVLTGTGTDADGDSVYYNWEQRDLGPQQDVNAGDNGLSPIFRSWEPTTNPSRTFPRLQDVIDGNPVRGETLPTTDRILDFRLTTRDFNPNGGGVATDNMRVDVTTDAGPFLVQSPNASTDVWEWDEMRTITWDVAGTDGNGINTSQVRILLSTDGGYTYPITLASDVANSGSHSIVVPNGIDTVDARVKVEAVGNIFFDISNADFTIQAPADHVSPTALLSVEDVTMEGANGHEISITYSDNIAIDLSTIGSFDFDVVAPDGTSATAFLISADAIDDTTPITGTYRYSAPGGNWDSADIGTYEIYMLENQVSDTSGNFVPAQLLGSFEVQFASAIDGDFNDDGLYDCNDINPLTTAVANGGDAAVFDLTGDGNITMSDVDAWLAESGAANLASGNSYLYGDANLDGVVDGLDFFIWNDHAFAETTHWCDANFDGNAIVDGLDFFIWNDNQFQSARRRVETEPKSVDEVVGSRRRIAKVKSATAAPTAESHKPIAYKVPTMSPRVARTSAFDRILQDSPEQSKWHDEAMGALFGDK